jgi:hypothetical protein
MYDARMYDVPVRYQDESFLRVFRGPISRSKVVSVLLKSNTGTVVLVHTKVQYRVPV